MVERLSCKQQVTGSIPVSGSQLPISGYRGYRLWPPTVRSQAGDGNPNTSYAQTPASRKRDLV